MKVFLSFALVSIFLIVLPQLSFAQNFTQMIKLIENDRENKTTAGRSADDNFGYSVSVSGN